jgi:hypothetical protein
VILGRDPPRVTALFVLEGAKPPLVLAVLPDSRMMAATYGMVRFVPPDHALEFWIAARSKANQRPFRRIAL